MSDAGGAWLGVDFSGDATRWRPGCRRPTVWIAEVTDRDGRPHLDALAPVQALTGEGPPFARLAARLAASDVRVAAIDAPLSVPAEVMPAMGYPGLLAAVSELEPGPKRDFPRGGELIARLLGPDAGYGVKRYRPNTQRWRDRGLNLRSPLWAGPRGGAPLLAAALALVARAGAPVWPMSAGPGCDLRVVPAGAVVEGYPAGQLSVWGLPHTRYGRQDAVGRALRETLVAAVSTRLQIAPADIATMQGSADALDAVLCALGARSATRGDQALPDDLTSDGFIYVSAA